MIASNGATMDGKVVVLGGGPAGLSAAYHLGAQCEVFERNDYLGGHCHTKKAGGYLFDEGAHVFFGKDECSRQFVLEPLSSELLSHKAEIWNNYGDRSYGMYPVQANANPLSPELAARCVLDFIEACNSPERDVLSYEDWCYASLGKSFADEFLLRYARKIWTVEPSEMTIEWLGSKVGGRISRPSLEQVVRGAIDPKPQALNYLTEFLYPNTGGFCRVLDPLTTQLNVTGATLQLGCGVSRIEADARMMYFDDGSRRRYEAAISTIPLPAFVNLAVDAPAEVKAAAGQLMWTSLRCVNLGVGRPNIGRGHWIYFYDHDVPFFRISFPYKFGPENAPEGRSSISCEIAYSSRKPLNEANLAGRVIDALRSTGVLKDSDKIEFEDQVDLPYSYVVFDFNRTAALNTIHSWMESVGIYPCGRFGEWGYHWSFEAMESGKRVAARVEEFLGVAATR